MYKLFSILILLVIAIPLSAQDLVRDSSGIDSKGVLRTSLVKKDTTKLISDTALVSRDTIGTSKDTTGLLSDSTFAKRDSLVPLHIFPLTDRSTIITSNFIRFNNFRYTENIIDSYSFSFLQDRGSMGYPSELFLYGSPNVGYLSNGNAIDFFSSAYNTWDLNNIQAEYIDSVEILPLPRSILYQGNSTVNFIYKDFLPLRPYTRIKYYQGAFDEALFDGSFNSLLYRRLYGYFQVTNRKLDRTYSNTKFTSWQVAARLKYLFSNDLNVSLSYNYSINYKGLNGGINADSITTNGVINQNIFYDEIFAPVNYYRQDFDQKIHRFELNVLALPFKNAFSNASVFYNFYESDLNNITDNPEYNSKDKRKMIGAYIKQYYYANYFSLNFNADYTYSDNYQKDILSHYSYLGNGTEKIFGLSGVLDLNLTDIIKPSFFYKYYAYSLGKTYGVSSFGLDLFSKKINFLTLYGGYSLDNIGGEAGHIFQSYASFDYKNLYLKAEVFSGKKSFYFISQRPYYPIKMSGVSSSLSFRIGSFVIEGQASHYFTDNEFSIPSFNSKAGIYFNDSLFRPNLLLKTGFDFNFIGKRTFNTQSNLINIPSNYTIDFNLSGEIRKVAVIYFTWENLLDRKYYIVPYYPMYRRNLRFGVSWELFN